MRRTWCAVVGAVGLAALAVPTAHAAPPQPTFSATLSEGPTCEFTAVGSFKNAKVDKVYATFFLDGTEGVNHLVSTETPGTGTLKSRTATFHIGPFVATVETHTVYVQVAFYSGGAHQGEVWTQISTQCSRP